MELTPEMIEQLKADLKKARTYQDLMGENGAIKKIIKASIEGMLDAELTEHLGYEKYSPTGKNTGNSRNGKTHKTLKNDNGEIELTVPRDRNGSFDPVVVQKYERTLGPIEDKIISMYAKGMTTRDIQSHVQEFYGLEVSASLVSQITDKIIICHLSCFYKLTFLRRHLSLFYKHHLLHFNKISCFKLIEISTCWENIIFFINTSPFNLMKSGFKRFIYKNSNLFSKKII